jgi:hypothetical protein
VRDGIGLKAAPIIPQKKKSSLATRNLNMVSCVKSVQKGSLSKKRHRKKSEQQFNILTSIEETSACEALPRTEPVAYTKFLRIQHTLAYLGKSPPLFDPIMSQITGKNRKTSRLGSFFCEEDPR